MNKRLLSVLLAVLMIVSLPTMAFASEVGCTHTQKVTTITDGETYQMNLSGKNKGGFTFEASGKNWNIKNSSGKYLNAEKGKLVLGDTAKTAWTYSKGAFSISEKTTQKNNGYWWGWIYIPVRGTKNVTTTYYLSTVTNGAKLSTCNVCAELYKTVSGEHDYGKAVYVDKTNHKYVCKYCGDMKTEAHSYDKTTHKCVCGAYDPAESNVKISVDVKEKTTKKYIGWWPWGYYKTVTTYTATIKTEAKGVKVTKVQYQMNGGKWTTGTCVTSERPIESLKVKARDNNCNIHEYEWPEKPVPVYYNVTAQVQGDHGTATVKVGDEEAATASQALEGTNLVFEATPNDGYEFDCWEVVSGGIDIEANKTNNPIAVTMPGAALTLKAHFKAIVPSAYDIIVEDDGHGTASADPTSAAPGTSVTLTATPNDGYAFKEWQINRGLEAGAITDNSFTMPSNEVKVKAVFEKEYAVEVEAGGHGTVSADVAKDVSGKEVNLTITPDEGYEVDQITVVRGGVTVVDNKFNIGTADVKIRVTFKAIVPATYNIIVEDDGHGTTKAQVENVDATSAAPGAKVTLSATANDGYVFKEWVDMRENAGEFDKTKATTTLTMPSNDIKVRATFERVFNITLQTNEHGTVSATVGGKTATTAPADAEVTLTATPADGYQLKEWKTVSGGVTVEDNKFSMPASNVTVQAVFEEASPTINTIADVLATAESDFPQLSSEDDTLDGDAWKASETDSETGDTWTKHCCLTYDGNSLHFFFLEMCKDISKNASVLQVENDYVYTDGTVTITFNMTRGVLSSIKFADTAKDTWNGEYFPQSECIAAGTMISMPGGTQKAVEELEIGDIICTFDHETGEVSSAPIAFIWESKNVGNAFTLTFEGDIEVTVIEEHGFYDKEEQKYIFINLQNAQEYIGDHFYDADTDSWLALKSCEALNDSVDAYAVITSGHLNHMSNGMLSMCDGSVKVLANIFEYDDQMKFDADKKKADIEAYGLTSKGKILELKGFTETDYDDYNLQYVDVMIGKGLITWEDMEALSDYCVANGL